MYTSLHTHITVEGKREAIKNLGQILGQLLTFPKILFMQEIDPLQRSMAKDHLLGIAYLAYLANTYCLFMSILHGS